MDTLSSLRVFCTVAEFKSFTAAADRLRLSPAMASKHVAHLEKRLGTRLLNRTSRHVSLTETGQLYFNQARQMVDGLDEVEAAVSNVAVMPRGTLRFSAPVWFASPVFAGILAQYQQRFPAVSFDIDLSGRRVNLVEEGFDLALRATRPDRLDPGLIARPLSEVHFHLVASPAYLDRVGRPTTVSDLNGHALLLYNGMPSSGTLTLDGPEGPEPVRFRVVMESANETMLQLGALQGMGVVFLPCWTVDEDVAQNRLESVLPGSSGLSFGGKLYAVYPSRKFLSAKVRTFIDFLAEHIARAADGEWSMRSTGRGQAETS